MSSRAGDPAASAEREAPILVLNSGSSSLKFAVFVRRDGDERQLLSGAADGIGRANGSLTITGAGGQRLLRREHVIESQGEALRALAAAFGEHLPSAVAALAHRVVHGGPHLRRHQLITPALLETLEGAVHFAPVHIPQALRLIRQSQQIFPGLPQFACFDTAFHATMPEVAWRLPIPKALSDLGIIRYGFHGLSCESVVARLRERMPERMVIAHLGNGASITAVQRGVSIDTSMGLTPTGGIPMSTRSGDLDPGVLLYLLRAQQLDAAALETLLNRQCGLLALSQGESDMRLLQQRATAGDHDAQLAIEAFTVAARKFIAGYAALLGGLDLLVFTGGIGEHSSEVRERIVKPLGFLGLEQPGKVAVLEAQEELQMARHARALLERDTAG